MSELSSIRCTESPFRFYRRSATSARCPQGLYQRCSVSRHRVDRNSHCCGVMKISGRQTINGDTRRGIHELCGIQIIEDVRYMYMSRGLACRAAGESEVAVESDGGGNIIVEIKLHDKHVEFGQAVAVLGSGEVLGNWAPECSTPLVWTEGDVWTGQVTIPKGSTAEFKAEFKFVVIVKGDETEVVEWEECNNRILEFSGGIEQVLCWWNDESRVELVSKESTDAKSDETKKKRAKSTKKPKVKSTKAKEEEIVPEEAEIVPEEQESSTSAEHHTPEPDVAIPSSNNNISTVIEDVMQENEEVVTYNFENGASESASEMAKRLLQDE